MSDDRLLSLLEAHLEGRQTPPEREELTSLLRSSAQARRRYWAYVEQHALIEDVLSETRGMDLANAFADAPAARPSPAAPRGRRWAWAGALASLAALLLIAVGLWPRRHDDPDPTPEPPAFATVQSLSGDVQLAGVPAAVGSPVRVGQTLRVGDDEDGRAEILFADGTQLTLASGSALQFAAPEGREGKRLHLEAGAVQVDATAQAAGDLVVTTDHARLTAWGSRFRVYRESRASRVEVESGKVRLDGLAEATTGEVPEGSYALVPDERQPMLTQALPVGHCRLRHTFLRGGDAVCFSPDGAQVVASHFGKGLKAWGAADGKLLASARGSGQRADGLAFTGADGVVIFLGRNGAASLWKVGEDQATTSHLREKKIRCAAASPDGRWLAQGVTNEVIVWEADAQTGAISQRRSLALKPSRVALSSAGPLVAVSQWGGEIRVFEVKTGEEIGQHKLSRTPTPLAISADGRSLAAYAIADGLVLIERRSGERRVLWPGEGARVSHLCFSHDGRVLLAALDDGTVRAWSAADGRALLVLDTGHRRVNQVTATADLSSLATVGDNDCVKIWEVVLP